MFGPSLAAVSAEVPFQSAAVLAAIGAAVAKDPSIVQKTNAIYQFNITSGGVTKSWVVDLKNGNGSVTEGAGKADTTLTVSDADFVAMSTGKLDSQMAFLQGKLKIAGSMGHAMKLNGLMSKTQDAVKAALANPAPAPAPAPAAPASAPAAAASAPAAAAGPEFKSAKVFEVLRKRIEAQGAELVNKVKAVYQFNITSGGVTKSWVVDLKNGSGSVTEGAGKADTTLTVSDADFVALNTGKLDSQMAFLQGKLKIAGSMGHAMKLGSVLTPISNL